ncbi:MAG: cupin domain-containing protein [Thermoleophilaceae bacterium]
MALVIPLEELRSSPTACLFEGEKHADGVPVSCFVLETTPGRGPALHIHPYPEVFVVQEGEATFTAGDEELIVTGGNVVVVPGETPHKFTNTGDRPLRMVTIHASGELIQTDLD